MTVMVCKRSENFSANDQNSCVEPLCTQRHDKCKAVSDDTIKLLKFSHVYFTTITCRVQCVKSGKMCSYNVPV